MKNPSTFTWPRTKATEAQRAQDADALKVRGTGYLPPSPNGLRVNSNGAGAILVDWDAPVIQKSPIVGWRVYLNSEGNLVQSIKDPSTTHAEIQVANGTYSVYVSSVNALGKESSLMSAKTAVTGSGGGGGTVTIPGPYADDTVAAAAGVTVGKPYYNARGFVFIRQV